jgi:DNA-binding IclR family transcriptional regulator
MAELETTRRRGYAVADEEAEPGVSSVAVAICPRENEFVGALAVVAPAFRLGLPRREEIAGLARKGAADLALVWPLRAFVQSDLGNSLPLGHAAAS